MASINRRSFIAGLGLAAFFTLLLGFLVISRFGSAGISSTLRLIVSATAAGCEYGDDHQRRKQ